MRAAREPAAREALSPSAYLDWCQSDAPRLRNLLDHWDLLYDHHAAELCERRRAIFREFYGEDIGVRSSLSLCLCERYTACVNFANRADGTVVHICDILPVVIGSRLDRRIRAEFWSRCDGDLCDSVECDRRKIGLVVQNKNYYHITVTMATNPKVAHIYRKSNKASQVDSRVYYYDKNFRGNMFYFKKYVLLVPCVGCLGRMHDSGADDEHVDSSADDRAPGKRCRGRTRLVIVEELYLRNCFKQDYLLLRRLCDGRAHRAPHSRLMQLLTAFARQFDHLNKRASVAKIDDNNRGEQNEESYDQLEDLLARLGNCALMADRCKYLTVKSHDFSLENDLHSFLDRCGGDHTAAAHRLSNKQQFMPKIAVTMQSGRAAAINGLLCDCEQHNIRESFERCIARKRVDGEVPSRSVAFDGCGGDDDPRCLTFVDNLQEFRKISNSCFVLDESPKDARGSDLSTRYIEQLYTIYTYMRSVIERNEDIDQLSNKCVFDGPYLYNKLLTQLREYLATRSLVDLQSVLVDTLISRYRQLSHTANLYMLISSKTNIRVELANDMKRSLKLSVKREKMQQTDYPSTSALTNTSTLFTPPSLSVVMASVFSVAPNVLTRPNDTAHASGTTYVGMTNSPCEAESVNDQGGDVDDGCPSAANNDEEDDEDNDSQPNQKCDFVVLMKSRPGTAKQQNLNTEFVQPNKLYLASCSRGDFIVRQLITYSGNYLLQNISASHFTDLEYIFESVKRPNVANQHNSIKCSFMPRNSVRFLSYYNMGNLSSAGRTLNICYRNKVTFFLNYERVTGTFERWLRRAVNIFADERADGCLEHRVAGCQRCMLRVLVNEVPLCDLLVDRAHETQLFFIVKMCWPAAQLYRKSSNILSVTLISGIIMIPMSMQCANRPLHPIIDRRHSVRPLLNDSWLWCEKCDRHYPFFAEDRSSNVVRLPGDFVARHMDERCVDGYRPRCEDLLGAEPDGGLRVCSRHLWFSSNDLEYYERHVLGRQLDAPFVYEISCHGLLFNCNFLHSTDISKLTVSINASRRRLRTRTNNRDNNDCQLESLVDQNSRLVVRSWSLNEEQSSETSTDDGVCEPLENIVQLPNSHNMFRCCFMFGDYHGLNVEDAYVFDERSRPLFDNVVQLKMNFYRNDKLPVSLDTVRLHFAPVLNLHPGGVILYLCSLVSNHKLSFGSTFVHVKITRIGECLWLYKFFYMNNSSYLREDEQVFANYTSGGCRFVEERRDELRLVPDACCDDVADLSDPAKKSDDERPRGNAQPNHRSPRPDWQRGGKQTNGGGNMIRVLFDETQTTVNGNVTLRCQLTNKQLRFVVNFRRVTSVVKWQNNCGNKGVSSSVDLSDLYTSRGGRVHAIVSAYSSIGRQLVAQILEQHSNAGDATSFDGNIMRVYSRKLNGQPVGYCGYGNFFFSCDSPHDTIIASSPSYGNNATRMCNMTFFAAIGNNLSTWIGNRSANHVSYKNNPINGMPINIGKCLSVYHSYNRQLYSHSLRIRELRKKIRDHRELARRSIASSLPTSCEFAGERERARHGTFITQS